MAAINKTPLRKNPAKKKAPVKKQTPSAIKKGVVKTIVKDLQDSQNGMFHTFKSMDDLIEKQNLRGEQVVYAMLAYNTTLEAVIRMLKSEYKIK